MEPEHILYTELPKSKQVICNKQAHDSTTFFFVHNFYHSG